MASDWLAAVLPANQMPGLKSLLTYIDFNMRNFLVTQAPGIFSHIFSKSNVFDY